MAKNEIKKDETIMAEWDRQTQANVETMEAYQNLFEETEGSSFSKLENFAKYVRRQRLSKFLAHAEIFRLVVDIHGSILDLGVNAGQSLFTWAQLSAIFESVNYTRTIVGFDTFAGIPSISKEDKEGRSPSEHLREGGFVFGDIEGLQRAIQAFDGNRNLGHIPKIELVQGDICKTLPAYLEENPHLVVSLLHLDMDVYQPTVVALENVVPRMPKGAVIVFDQINQIPYPGETRALADTLGINSLRIERFPWETGLSYAVIE